MNDPNRNTRRPTVAEWVAAVPELKRVGGQYQGPCPGCGGDDRFHVKEKGDGSALVGCRGCLDSNVPEDERRRNYGNIMADVFPDLTSPRRVNGSGAARSTNEDQPKTREGLRVVLESFGYGWRYNTRAMRDELRHNGSEWREANDRFIRDVRSQIPERFTEAGKEKALFFGRNAFEDSFGALLNRAEVDPFKEWLDALPKWKGESRGLTDGSGTTSAWRTNTRRSRSGRRGSCFSEPCGAPTRPGRSSTKCRF